MVKETLWRNVLMEKVLNRLVDECRGFTLKGKLASYIPELLKANSDALGICLIDNEGNVFQSGDYNTAFTIQSVSKVVTLIYGLEHYGDSLFSRIGVEQTADAFNSIIKLETRNNGKPLNPLINAGAIATTSFVVEREGVQAFEKVVGFLRKLAENDEISVNESVYKSEMRTGDVNRALAYYQKGAKTFSAEVDDVLEVYFKMCSLEVKVKDLAQIARVIADNGVLMKTGERLFSKDTARMAKAIMTTCGLYDSSGRFALDVGIPSKSGVGGGILSVVPGQLGIGTLGPALDDKGNSAAGVELLKRLSKELHLSIFE